MKSIVLLSDGTGNGAAKRHRTNVWRLYNALDLHRGDQIAFYDDGVGAQEFLPLKIIGGAFGWGLKRNVLELYKFLCRTYQPGNGNAAADKIYLFGFSRGAFTVRLLAGMIARCGLCSVFNDEADLDRIARRNYNAFRASFKQTVLSRAYRALARIEADVHQSLYPDIEFIGVWDTVDAYGMPIDELAVLWDKIIFPIRFPDRQLSTKVRKGCHALSIDDERQTFHPMLWDESQEQRRVHASEVQAERIEQVWFAGVHSDVGGGYPMYDLALVSLDWMISKVEATSPSGTGLHFIREIRDEYISRSDWHGIQHDSRSGLAAYYRYRPRNIELICNDTEGKVFITKPKIHRSVLERTQGNIVPYAPTALPASYETVATHGTAPLYQTPAQSKMTAEAMNYALDLIYWRRWLYTALLITTVLLVISRFALDWIPDGVCQGGASCLLDPVLDLVIAVLPGLAAGWFEALKQNPTWLWGLILAFTFFFVLKRRAWNKTRSKAAAAWAELKGRSAPPKWTPTLTSALREVACSKYSPVIKWSMAGGAFVLVVVLILVLAARSSLFVRSTFGGICENSSPIELATSRSVTFETVDPCFATGVTLKKGNPYRFQVTDNGWFDGGYKADPIGFSAPELRWWIPLRRELSEPWFKLMGRIGSTGNDEFPIGSGLKDLTARSDGELFLYVNDAVFGFLPGRYWAWPYFWDVGLNKGTATVTVTALKADQVRSRRGSATGEGD